MTPLSYVSIQPYESDNAYMTPFSVRIALIPNAALETNLLRECIIGR
jgi:hypothetical protein